MSVLRIDQEYWVKNPMAKQAMLGIFNQHADRIKVKGTKAIQVSIQQFIQA